MPAPGPTAAHSTLPPKNIEIDSLKHLDRLLLEQRKHRVLLPVDEKWFELIHGGDDRVARAPPSAIVSELGRLAERDPVKPATAVVDRVAAVVPGSRKGEFMGPMCCPLTKVNFATIKNPDNKYLITEKSDGLRAILLSVAEEDFPRWTIIPEEPAEGVPAAPRACKNLYDTAMLESALIFVYESSGTAKHGVKLSTGTVSLLVSDDDSDVHTLRTADGTQTRWKRTREPRHFTYLFDRTLRNVYMLLEEVPFSPDMTDIVLDGELIFSFARGAPQCVFSCFDVFSWEKITRGVNSSVSTNREIIADASMSERYAMIHDDVLRPMFEHAKRTVRPIPTGIALVRKTMVTVHQLPELINQIFVVPNQDDSKGPRSSDGDCKYFFGPTASYNDGLVFTPDKFNLAAGSCPTQFKWKWPAKLTVDFLLTDAPGSDPADQSDGFAQRVTMELLFRQRGSRGFEDKSGHVFFANEIVFNPHQLDLRSKSAAGTTKVVAECCLARGPSTGIVRWRIEKLRRDKTEANAAITAFSVIESIAENITVVALCTGLDLNLPAHLVQRFTFPVHAVAVQQAGTEGDANDTTATPIAPTPIPIPRMIVRARLVEGVAQPALQWQIRLPDMAKGALTCNHRTVSACYGLGEPCPEEDPQSPLVGRIMIELANNGGCVGWSDTTCAVAFDARVGRWAILSVSGDKGLKSSAFSGHVFHHIAAIAKHVTATGGDLPEIEGLADAAPRRLAPEVIAMLKAMGGAEATAVVEGATLGAGAASDGHYAQRTRELASTNNKRSALRYHNNWVKAILLDQATQLAKSTAPAGGADGLTMLDLCAGRGGDLHKYVLMKLKHVVLVDSCFEAVAEAAGRYSVGGGLSTCTIDKIKTGMPMTFCVGDCFDDLRLLPVLRLQLANRGLAVGGFDVVSCQFSMHYAFKDIKCVRGFLNIVQQSLRPGGVFAATTVDDEALLSWRRRCGDEFGNGAFRVKFLDPQPDTYGLAYRITVQTSVVDEVEWVVDFAKFVSVAAEFGLDLVESCNFQRVHETDGTNDRLEAMLASVLGENGGAAADAKKRTRTSSGRAEMSPDEAATAALFRTVLLRKRME